MSKLHDVEKMYGQDFSIVVTNAPSNIVKQSKKLLPNTILISSPQDEHNEDTDNNMPALFATDYNAQPLQLTYPFYMKNGLNYSEKYGYAFINIDNNTIKTENDDGTGKLKVETSNLTYASFSNKGVVQLSSVDTNIYRSLKENYNLEDSIASKYNNSTFITVDDNGILYINNDFINLINNIVDVKIKQKIDSIKVMLNNNLKIWIVISKINNVPSETIYNLGSFESINLDSTISTTITFDLFYLSFNNESETVNIIDTTNKIFNIEFENNNNQTIVSQLQNNDELYQHKISNITLTFLPNYFVENNTINSQEYQVQFSFDGDRSEVLSFKQNKLDNFSDDTFGISLENDTLYVADILDTSALSSLMFKIKNNVLIPVQLNNENIIDFKLNFYIKNRNGGNNLNLLVNDYEYKYGDNRVDVTNEESKSLLYTFINNIIDTNIENDDQAEYTILFGNIVNLSDDVEISVDDFIESKQTLNSLQYFMTVCANFNISNKTSGVDFGTFTVPTTINLNLNREIIYGYLEFNNNGDISYNLPSHVYYENRSGQNRTEVTSNSVEPSTIITTKLYCILSEDLKIENDNIKDFAIYVNAFKTYNKFDTENTENQNINVENISLYGSSEQFENNGTEIGYKINDNDDDNKFIQIKINPTNGIMFLLTDGLTLDINYEGAQSQTVYLYANILEIMLNNINFYNIVDIENANDDNKRQLSNYCPNLNDTTSSNYYNMNNYEVNISNFETKAIKFEIPQYVESLLNSNQNMSFKITVIICINGNENQQINQQIIISKTSRGIEISNDLLRLVSLEESNKSFKLVSNSDNEDTIIDIKEIDFGIATNNEEAYKKRCIINIINNNEE